MSGQRNLAAEVERWCLDRGLGHRPPPPATPKGTMTAEQARRQILAREYLRRARICRAPEPLAPPPEEPPTHD